MSFLEEIASRLDREGLESRAVGDELHVPVGPEVELRFAAVRGRIPAATVDVAAANVTEDEEGFTRALVDVIFDAEDALAAVLHHVAMDEVVTLVQRLLDGDDERLAGLDFAQDAEDATMVVAEPVPGSELIVTVESAEDEATAAVALRALDADGAPGPALELGEFADPERLLDVLELVVEHAADWVAQLADFDAWEEPAP